MQKLIIFAFIFSFHQIFSQSTWVKTYFVEYYFSSTHDSTTVGPHEISISPNGTIYSLLQIDQNHDSWLVALDSAGNIKWLRSAGFHGGIQYENPYDLHSTYDNGCIYRIQHIGSNMSDSIYRLNSTGNVVWSKYYNHLNFVQYVLSVTQTSYNTTIIQFADSLVEFDSLGQFIRFRTPFSFNARIYHLPDSNILRIDSGLVIKENFNGIQYWSIPLSHSNNIVKVSSDGNIFLSSGDSIMKLDSNNGNIIWNLPINSDEFTPTTDSGFAISQGNLLSKFNSAGILVWTKNIPLPDFGLKCINQLPDNSFTVGGGWRMYNNGYYYPFRYCPMIIKVNSLGNGVIDSTDFFWCGNANDNNHLSFGNDAVFIAAAMGNSGMPRDSVLFGNSDRSVYATNWAGNFNTGINYKYSDVDGNGSIDSTDIILLAQYYYLWGSYFPHTPHWERQSNSVNPELHFHVSNNHPSAGDSVEINITVGSLNFPADSIYGLSFDLRLSTIHANYSPDSIYTNYYIPNTSFGDTSTNLYNYFYFNEMGIPGTISMVLCRNDQQNVYLSGDTVARITYYMKDIIFSTDTVILSVDWNAITANGNPLNFDLITDSIFMSGINSVKNISKNRITIYPNPASDNLSLLFNDDKRKEIKLFDSTGRIVFTTNCTTLNCNIDIKDFGNGLYYIVTGNAGGISRNKFMISR